MDKKIKSKLKEIVGQNNFFDSNEDKLTYSYDATPIFNELPEAVIFPENTLQISNIIKLANTEKFNIVPRGAGTGLSGGSIPVENSIALVMTKWNNILEIDHSNLTVTVEPGVITQNLQNEVEKLNLFYPPDPGSASVCTIGGNISNNAGGLRGLKYGVTKNYVMGVEMVLPNGEILKTGGKNVKDAAGYNLKDFIVGSEGTLGVITKATLKLIHKPKSFSTIIAFFESMKDCSKTISDIFNCNLTPAMMEYIDNTTLKCIEDYAKLGLPKAAEAVLLFEFDGREEEVKEDTNNLEMILNNNNAYSVKKAKTLLESSKLKAARRSAFSALARVKPTTILEDATVPRAEFPMLIELVNKAGKDNKVLFGIFGHAGDGNLHPTCLTDERNKNEIERAHKAFDFIFNETIKLGGTITGEHGTGLSKKEFLENVAGIPGVEMMKKIKSVIDENNILNPGKIFTTSPRCEGNLPFNNKQIKPFNG
ncbi:MAG: glycolate oxidase subunit GlcD [Ignavibacteriales bacterium CG_4_9_14_3_um_filter_30_11]|nr:MAG: glycolate oxidase subunit GlcD [Ignavibacteriales bacterium CG_4_9_14_3_um_filter_30_11]